MREIKFRGKRISDNSWVFGGIVHTFHPNYDSASQIDFFMMTPNCYAICANNKDYFVEQNSIGQYTGLKDCNGKEIYEGDILKRTVAKENGFGNYISVVDYKAGGFILKEEYGYCPFHDVFGSTFEVIGNIHDNPELLEVKE